MGPAAQLAGVPGPARQARMHVSRCAGWGTTAAALLQLEAADEKGRKSAQQHVDRAASRLNAVGKELGSLRAIPAPRIEVRSPAIGLCAC